MKMFVIQWLFDNEDIARKAITNAIEDGEVATSFGVGDDQYIGYDFSEGKITYTNVIIGSREFCQVDWEAKAQEEDKDYWLSPHCFEGYETFEVKAVNARGESNHFGLRVRG